MFVLHRVRIEKKLVLSLDSDYSDTRNICLPNLKHGDTELFLMSFRLARKYWKLFVLEINNKTCD